MDDEDKLRPRKYQEELMKIAIKQNTIIYLPTGSGKTFIAIMVLKHLGDDLMIPYSQGGKITCILVNSVPLVDQHKKYVRDHTIFISGGFSGEMNLDFWTKEQWEEQFDKYQVLVMTCQIMDNLLTNCFIDLHRINLMIFDECHHGVTDHPMRQIMKQFQTVDRPPRVLGLTATLLNANCKLSKVMDEVKNLEITYNSKVATVNGLEEVVGFSTNPQEKFEISKETVPINHEQQIVTDRLKSTVAILSNIKFENYPENDRMLKNNLKLLTPVDVLKELKNLIKDLIFHIDLFGVFGGYKACMCCMIQIERIKKHCQETLTFVILNYVITVLGWSKNILKTSMRNFSPQDQIYKFSTDKVVKLFEILKCYKSLSDEELCCLIFVTRKFTAKVLHHILQSLKGADKTFSHLTSNFVVGNSCNPYNDTRETLFISKKNREIIGDFINKDINVLVSSSVLEEGVDIPKCTLVVRFDKPTEYRSYIQSKGRARHKKSLFYIIVEQNCAQKFFAKYEEFRRIEEHLNSFLVGKNLEREGPSKNDLETMYNEDQIPPYYVNGPNSAHVSLISAISLLCRYCNSLNRDQYTNYAAEWYLDDTSNDKRCRVHIFLPIECPILEPITGPFMYSKRNAKRAAALVACMLLHKCGELNDDLLPVKKNVSEDISFLFQHWSDERGKDTGNKKKKRLHDREVAACIKGKIEPKQPLHLHVIMLHPTYRATETYATICDSYKSSLRFGFLSPKPLPDFCSFPIFDSQGLIEVHVKTNCKVLTLSSEELYHLREFHYLLFNDLLEILKQFLIFDNNGNSAEMLLVVPVQNEIDVFIDFKTVQEHKTLKNKLEPTSSERVNIEVSEESYLHKIVSPWYRAQPTMYVVTQVCLDKNPLSVFPNEQYKDFVCYFEEKHGLKILNTSQPLLLVKGLSKSLNCFKPAGKQAQKKKEKRYEEVQEYLVPELVIKQDFPSCLWIQARFLPSILSRVTYLLKLQELQFRIASEIGAKEHYLRNCPSLKLDPHLLNYEPNDGQLVSQAEALGIYTEGNLLPIENPGTLMQQYNKDFAVKMLESEYCWKNLEEPKDIERDLNVTVMDIEYYENFINQKMTQENRLLKNESPLKLPNVPAITYDRKFNHKTLQILEINFDNQIPNLGTYYQALTAAEANDIVNLERLETLGDSFLKLISSLYILFKFPKYNEGKCTSLKGALVSNKNLYYLAVRKNFGGILKNYNLSPNTEWVPPCFSAPQFLSEGIRNREHSINTLFNCYVPSDEQITGNLSKKTISSVEKECFTADEENSYPSMCHFINKQYVSDKTVADTVEALLGAHLLKGGFKGAVKFVEWIEIIPASEKVLYLIEHSEINPVANPRAANDMILFHIPQWRELEKRLGYSFKNPAFLLQALTHGSYSPNRITHSYERLEFIGDAILDFLITCFIYEHCGNLGPGEVTDLRSALVNNNTFASLVVRSGFHKFLLLLNSKLQKQIDKFADYLETKNYVIDDEVLILLEEEEINIAEYVDVPKVLGDIFEALAGAVYLDSNKNLKTVWQVFYGIMWQEIDLFSKNVPKNVIRRLYECHTAYPQFSTGHETENDKIMVSLKFMCEGRKKVVHGFGTNKTMAKKAAAKIALRALKI